MHFHRSRPTMLLLLLSALGFAGCGDSDKPEMAPVKGKVTYNGEPVDGASVTFTPEAGSPATGMTDSVGEFTLRTLGEEGAAIGQHVVTIAKMDSKPVDASDGAPAGPPDPTAEPPKNLLPSKYANPTSTDLKRAVEAVELNEFTFELEN